MSKKYTPAIFQPTLRPSWAGALYYISQEEKSLILEAIVNYPKYIEIKSRFWEETIKPDLEAQYESFVNTCLAKGRGAKSYWDKISKEKYNISITDDKEEDNICLPYGELEDNSLKDKDKDKDKSKDKSKNNNKIKESDVVDWDSLFLYWEQNKEGGKYKNSESRSRMLGRLQTLTNNDLSFAKEVILDAIDHKWQGFCGADGLYYKKPKLASNENIEYRRADSEETHKMASLAEITKKRLEEERIRKFGS